MKYFIKTKSQKRGGALNSSQSVLAAENFGSSLFRVLVAMVLCFSLMIPSVASINSVAYAAEEDETVFVEEEQQVIVDDEQDVLEQEASEGKEIVEGEVFSSDSVEPLSDVAPLDVPAVTTPVNSYSIAASHGEDAVGEDQLSTSQVQIVLKTRYSDLEVSDAAALAGAFTIVKANGDADTRYASVEAALSPEGNSIVVTAKLQGGLYAITDGIIHLKTNGVDGLVPGVHANTTANGEPVQAGIILNRPGFTGDSIP